MPKLAPVTADLVRVWRTASALGDRAAASPRPRARRRTAIRSGRVALGAISVGAIALLMVGGPGPAAAATGTWGANHSPYSNGVICQLGPTTPAAATPAPPIATVPLVAWKLQNVTQPSFLLASIEETGAVDSGQPPIAASISAPDAPLAANSYGSFSGSQLAALAYLISTWGADPTPARVAEVSELVAEQAGHANGTACLDQGQGATSTAEAASMWTAAQRLAGPYRVAVTTTATQVVYGQPIVLRATVTSARGLAVPGLTVTFASSDGGSSARRSRTQPA